MNDCCKDLEKLKKDFTKLLIANGNIMKYNNRRNNNNNNVFLNTTNGIEEQLRNERFAPSVIKKVANKIRRSGRPTSNYSKTTGLLKKY